MKSPLRTLHLLDHADLGGGETSFVAFLQAALARSDDIDPHVIARERGPLADAIEKLGVEPEIIDYPMRFRRLAMPVLGREASARIGEAIDRRKIELVHANNLFGLAWGGAAAKKRRLPVVWTCHGAWEARGLYQRRMIASTADLALCVSEAVRRAIEPGIAGRIAMAVDHLGVAPFAAGEIREDRRKIRQAVREELMIGEETPLIAVAGRFQPVKGHALLLAAAPKLFERFPQLRILFIGEALFGSQDENDEKHRLISQVEGAGWGERIRFLGWRDDARRLMRGLDALIIPSASESFGMAAVEGLEAGIAVVATDRGGTPEIVAPPATGQLFRSGNADDLAARVLDVLESRAGFDDGAGPKRVAAGFTAEAHLERTLRAYRELLKTRSGERRG